MDQREKPASVSMMTGRLQAVTDVTIFMFLFGVIMLFVTDLLARVEQYVLSGKWQNSLGIQTLNEVLTLFSVWMAAWIVLRFRRLPFSGLGLSLKGRGKDLLYGILFAICLYAIGFSMSLLWGVVGVTGVCFSPVDWLQGLFFFLLVGVVEELMVRGFVLGRLLDGGMNRFVALFISSMLFSVLHLLNPNFAFVPFLNILLAGLLLGASYLYTRNLCFPIALHWFWNWLQGPVLGYEVSGVRYTESLFTLHLSDDKLLNGGAFGFEGSLICSFLLIIGTGLIIGYYERDRC